MSLPKSPSETRLVFFGTPELAVPSLEALVAAHFQITAVVTQPDAPVGRKQVITPPPLKQRAEQLGLRVVQPKKIRTPEFEQWLRQQSPDVCVIVAYGKIIPPNVLAVPPLGFVNVHPSLLPLLRGASPITAAIAQGLANTGVSIMLLDAGMDTGPLLQQLSFPIPARATTDWLHDQMKLLGAQELVHTLTQYIHGKLSPRPQVGPGSATTLLDRRDGEVKWDNGPEYIDRLVRAFVPYPGVTLMDGDKRLKLIRTDLRENQLILQQVQVPGKNVISGAQFHQGYSDWKLPDWVQCE